MRRLLLLVMFLLPVTTVAAADLQQGEQCTIGPEQVVEGNLHAVCQSLVVDGIVRGDVVALTGSAVIRGTVEGDITAIAGQVTVEGAVGGDIRAVAGRLTLGPGARLLGDQADIAGIGLSAELLGAVPGDVLFLGYQGILGGAVGGSVQFNGVALTLNGQVEGSADIHVESPATALRPPDIPALGLSFIRQGLSLGQGAVVRGNLRYESPQQASIEPGAIGGEIRFTQTSSGGQIGIAPVGEVVGNYIGRILRDLLALVAVGLVALLLAQDGLQAASWRLRSRWQASFGYGLLTYLMFFPLALLLVAFNVTVLGLVHLLTLGELTLTTALLLAIIDLVFVGGFWFVVAFLARIVVCYVIGQRIGVRILLTTDRATTLVISMLIGVVLYAAISNLPIGPVAFVVNAVLTFLGLGAIVLSVRDRLSMRRHLPLPAHALVSEPAPIRADGVPEDFESLPGMDNLPEGFTWFDR